MHRVNYVDHLSTGNICALLPDDWLFDFLDGGIDCEAAHEVKNVFPGPYYCWYRDPTFENVRKAHLRIDELIGEEEFDGVLGFSQGAALAASYLLHRQQNDSTPALKLAILASASLPFSIDNEHGVAMSDPEFSTARPEVYLQQLKATSDRWSARRWTPQRDCIRLRVPTVHVYGTQDVYQSQSKELSELCEDATATVIRHREGHWIPSNEMISRKIANAMMQAINC